MSDENSDKSTHYQFGAQANHDEPEKERRGLFGRRKRKGIVSKALDIGRESASKGIDVGAEAVTKIGDGWSQRSAQKHELEMERLRLERLESAGSQNRDDAKTLEEDEKKDEQKGPEENYGGDGAEEEYMFFYRRSEETEL